MTLDEKIKAAVTEIQQVVLENEHLVGYPMMEAVLRRHLTEPWLDAPNAPGWWWQKYPDGFMFPVYLTNTKLPRAKSQFQWITEPTEDVT